MAYAEEGMAEYLRGSSAAGAKPRKTEAQIRAQMKRIQAGYGRRAQRIAKATQAVAGGAGKAAGAAAVATGARGLISRMGLPGLLIGTLAYPVMERLIYGSREDQMRDQFDLQRKLEQEEMGRMGDMGGVQGGLAGGAMMAPQEDSMYDLMEAEKMTGSMNRFAQSRNRALEALERPSGSEEMERLLAGQEARIRSIQSPRQLTPYEIMGILDG
jgi:hypothetical protein